MATKEHRKGSRIPRREAYTLKNLDQIKVLADPLRIRVLEAFCQERTTKQVADVLGENATKLYHHVDALERVGLIAPSRTRQNRGTVEKYYLAVARTFRASSRAFEPKGKRAGEKSAALMKMMSNIFDTTAAELAALLDRGDVARKSFEEQGIVSFLEVRASKAKLKELRGKLHDIVRSLTADAEHCDDDQEQGSCRFTLAYYPLEGAKQGPRRKS